MRQCFPWGAGQNASAESGEDGLLSCNKLANICMQAQVQGSPRPCAASLCNHVLAVRGRVGACMACLDASKGTDSPPVAGAAGLPSVSLVCNQQLPQPVFPHIQKMGFLLQGQARNPKTKQHQSMQAANTWLPRNIPTAPRLWKQCCWAIR